MSDEVKPSKNGTLEVPSGTAPEQVPTASDSKPKRGRKLIGTAPLTGAQRQARHQERAREKRNADSVKYDSKLEVTKPEGKHLLELRGLADLRVIDTVYDGIVRAADELGLSKNRFLFSHGIVRTLKSFESGEPKLLGEVADESVVGELSNRAELVALHDVYAWREDAIADGHKDFDDFLRLRRLAKTSACKVGEFTGSGFDFEKCQEDWEQFFPRFNPDALPPNYTQKQMHQWLASCLAETEYLAIATRNSGKSHFVLFKLLTLHLCCPDARALLVSETNKLSAGFIRKYRSFWEVKPHQETLLQKLFPEYCISPGAGSKLEFSSPMAHLDLIQASATSTSMESVVAGGRAEVLLFDDPISNLSCSTEEQRKKSVDLYDLLQKLREVNASFSITIGTPWYGATPDGEGNFDGDLYAVLMKRNEESADKSLAVRVDPIATVKKEAQHKLTPALLPTLVPEDIESYLQPNRLSWRFIKKEIAANPAFALSQNFCIFPKDEDSGLRITFEETQLRAHTRPIGSFDGLGQTYLALDRAWSVARYADLSCVCALKIMQVNGKQACVVMDVRMDRWRESELIANVVEMIRKHSPRAVVMERDKGWQDFDLAIRRGCQIKGLPIPYLVWKQIPTGGHNARSKMKRIKILELPLTDGRIWFASSALWNDSCFAQMVKVDGVSVSNSHRKDDFPDCLSLGFSEFGPRRSEEIEPTEQEKRDKEIEDEQLQEMRRQHYESMFGDSYLRPSTKVSEWIQQQRGAPQTDPVGPEQKRDPRLKGLPPGFRM